MHPTVRPNIYGFDYVFGEDLWREYGNTLRDPAAMRAYLRRYQVEFFLVDFVTLAPEVLRDLQATGWVPVFYEDRAFILVPRQPSMEALIQREGYRVISPLPGFNVNTSDAPQFLAEAERILQRCPAAGFAHAFRADALRILHRDAEAEAAKRFIPPVPMFVGE